MKLYVWNDIYPVSYGSTCLYVIAENLRQARKLAREARLARFGRVTDGEHVDLTSETAKLQPTRVHALPHAEVYEWSE